jgi:hypothetical protein
MFRLDPSVRGRRGVRNEMTTPQQRLHQTNGPPPASPSPKCRQRRPALPTRPLILTQAAPVACRTLPLSPRPLCQRSGVRGQGSGFRGEGVKGLCLPNFQFAFFTSQFSIRRPLTLDLGPWTLDLGPWTLDFGPWTLDFGLWTFDPPCPCIFTTIKNLLPTNSAATSFANTSCAIFPSH